MRRTAAHRLSLIERNLADVKRMQKVLKYRVAQSI